MDDTGLMGMLHTAGQLLGQGDHVLVVEIGPGHVDQPGRLVLDGFYDARMAMAGGDHGDPGIKVEKSVAIDVGDVDHRGQVARVLERVRARDEERPVRAGGDVRVIAWR